MSDIVKFGSYDLEEAKREKAELNSGSNFLKLRQGRNVLRILPPPVGRKSPFVRVWQHFFNVPGKEKAASFTCPRMMAKKHCPACAKADELKASGNPADKALANDMFARKRVYANVVDRSAPELGVQIFAFGKMVDDALVSLREDDPDEDFTHPIEGFDVIVERSGTGKMDTKYSVRGARNRSQLAPSAQEMNELIESMPDLAKFGQVPDAAALAEMLGSSERNGGSTRQLVDAEVVESRPVRGKRRTMQDEFDDEDEQD